jgi:outer membrane protein OmpA-like peptidoglycan-associated protein
MRLSMPDPWNAERDPARRTRALAGMTLAAGLAALAPAFGSAPEPPPATRPAGNWQVPGEIQQPKGNWQVPGEIQKPGEIQTVAETCRTRLVVGADALFEFDKAELSSSAEASLAALGPRIRELSSASKKTPKTTIEGHTDAKGDDAYNDGLSERRARAVRTWLAARGFVAAETPIVGRGERHPVAPNARPDGSDDPEGRAKNRRVEVVLATCEP